VSDDTNPLNITGTPDRPNLKRHSLMLVVALLAYASFMTAMIVWALKLRHSR
jgi:hypothetical protein